MNLEQDIARMEQELADMKRQLEEQKKSKWDESCKLRQDEVLHLFEYQKDGSLYKKQKGGSLKKASDNLDSKGYKRVQVNGTRYLQHRIIFLYHNGYMPKFVDHINQDKSDNRIENLRETTKSLNGKNCKMYSNNKSGYSGVNKRSSGRWQATIRVNNKTIYIGTYDTFIEAVQARQEAEVEYDFSKNHCKPVDSKKAAREICDALNSGELML